ncbi:MAG: hypothetical protein IJ642_01420 [Oscillospiraceae bacterium]|nr:hypothetical protein [Oscillospiraceae bacterium]
MSYLIQKRKYFPVTFDTLTIFLSDYQISGSSTLKESCTADGSAVLTAYWKQGSRLKLKGKLSPDLSPEQVLLHLLQNMLTPQTFTLGSLSFSNARLCGYTLAEQQDTPELSLLFYCPEAPSLIQEEPSA